MGSHAPLRIAMVIDPWREPFSGTVVSTRRFVQALEAAGHAVNLLAIGDGQSAAEVSATAFTGFDQLSAPGFNGIIAAMRSPLAKPNRARIREALRTCDLLHVQYPFLLGHAAIVEARRMRLPVVCSFHVQPENILANIGLPRDWLRSPVYRLFVGAFYDRADVVVAPTPFAADLLRRHGVRRTIRVISNGVPEALFGPAWAPRSRTNGRFRVLTVGRLAAEKDQATLLRAVGSCRRADAIELTLVGAGPKEAELKRLALALGLDARIGPVSDEALAALYRETDLFIHPGGVELEGMSALDAMAMGRPLLVSDSPDSALSHLITDDRARFRAGDPSDLAAKIDDWLDHPTVLAEQGMANRRLAECFNHDRSVVALVAAYDEAIAINRRGPE